MKLCMEMKCLLAFVMLLVVAQTKGVCLNRNLALNKPAIQSSDDKTFSTWTADLAVDGNHDTIAGDGSCSHTGDDGHSVQSWWQVDLQDVYIIQRIAITNRGDCCEVRLTDFSILLYKTDPENTVTEPEVCRVHTGTLTSVKATSLACTAKTSGRYLRIRYNNYSAVYLTLCEVEVYGHQPITLGGPFQLTYSLKTKSKEGTYVVATQQNTTKMACLKDCYFAPSCLGFNFREMADPTLSICELFNGMSLLTADPDWNIYFLC